MDVKEVRSSLTSDTPADGWEAPLAALWWDAKGNWAAAHALVDELETMQGMAVHAYLHRKQGEDSNAEYWYKRAGRNCYRTDFVEEWEALVAGIGPQER